MDNLELSVYRKWKKDVYTIGKLYIDSQYHCDTLEDPIRNLSDYNHDGDFTDPGEGKIYGQTAIPCGTYQVIVSYSPKFDKRLPELLNVPGFTNIRIHSGADAKHTDGCILIGENKQKGRLQNGPYYQNILVDRIDEAINNGEKCYITVKE